MIEKMAKKAIAFEEAMTRLQEIVSLLEDETLSLEQSLKLYEEGTKMAEICHKSLTSAELKISQLSQWEEKAENNTEEEA